MSQSLYCDQLMKLDEPVIDTNKALPQAEMLGIIEEQTLELQKLKAEVSALGDQVAKPNVLMLKSQVHSAAEQAIKVFEQQVLDTARMVQADATASKRVISWGHLKSSLTPQEMT
ncbi:unnamed protein product [Echinostoma caproni]|uniref:SKA2 domain-containing protein n=1 Tax=Echinostoma caproni TaxID=27848 RepID=A0A183BDZ4_9TREM|nr:unnamed protein product [Echinostoma caproni]